MTRPPVLIKNTNKFGKVTNKWYVRIGKEWKMFGQKEWEDHGQEWVSKQLLKTHAADQDDTA